MVYMSERAIYGSIWALVACGALILICLILGIWNCCCRFPKPDADTKSDPNTKREYQVAMSNRLFQVSKILIEKNNYKRTSILLQSARLKISFQQALHVTKSKTGNEIGHKIISLGNQEKEAFRSMDSPSGYLSKIHNCLLNTLYVIFFRILKWDLTYPACIVNVLKWVKLLATKMFVQNVDKLSPD